MKRSLVIIAAIVAASFLSGIFVYAEVPRLIRFQGKVTDIEGAPLNGSYNITFRVYDAESGGTLMWSETQSAIPVNSGIFTVLLGNVASLDLAFDIPYWLSMEVSDDGEMSPRQQITSVGYAIRAEVADSISNVTLMPSGAIVLWRGATCPEGYTRVSELDNKFLVSGATYNSAAGGSNTHDHGAGSYAGPNHAHSFSGTTSGDAFAGPRYDGSSSPVSVPGHTHPFSGTTNSAGGGGISGISATADSRPEFATILLCDLSILTSVPPYQSSLYSIILTRSPHDAYEIAFASRLLRTMFLMARSSIATRSCLRTIFRDSLWRKSCLISRIRAY